MFNNEEFEQEIHFEYDIIFKENIHIGFEVEEPMKGEWDILSDYGKSNNLDSNPEKDGTRKNIRFQFSTLMHP